MSIENKYYLYRHVRLDKNEPFYIGVGTKEEDHHNTIKSEYARAFVASYRNPIWTKIFNKSKYKVEILFESNNINLINFKETEFIKLYGRINCKTGILANMTDGGEENSGHVVSEETKKKLSIVSKNYWSKLSKEERITKTSDAMKKAREGYKLAGYPKTYTKQREYLNKKVIDTVTNIIHPSISEAYRQNNFKFTKAHLCAMLAGKYKNKTNLIYYN